MTPDEPTYLDHLVTYLLPKHRMMLFKVKSCVNLLVNSTVPMKLQVFNNYDKKILNKNSQTRQSPFKS